VFCLPLKKVEEKMTGMREGGGGKGYTYREMRKAERLIKS
jgi:hypothetical protein